MKKENSFFSFMGVGVGAVVLLSCIVLFAVIFEIFVGSVQTKPVVRDTSVVQVVHDAKYYTDALIADRAIIPGLGGVEGIGSALVYGRGNPKYLAEFFIKIAGVYAEFSGRTKYQNQSVDAYGKYAFWTYMAGTVYFVGLDDNEMACRYYAAALSADQNNPRYKEDYGSPACEPYRHK